MSVNCNHTPRSVFFFLLLCVAYCFIWKCSSCSACGGLVCDHAWVVRFQLCGNRGFFSTVQCSPCRPHHNGPACQPWHQETWKSLKGRIHPSVAEGQSLLTFLITFSIRIKFFIFFLPVHKRRVCVWNVSFHQIKDTFLAEWCRPSHNHPCSALYPLFLIVPMQGSPHTRLCFSENPKNGNNIPWLKCSQLPVKTAQIFEQSISYRTRLLYLTSLYPFFHNYHIHMLHICLIIMGVFPLVFSKVVKSGGR